MAAVKPRTKATAAAARVNGRAGGRPRNDYGSAAMRRRREQARRLGQNELLESVKFLMWVRDNPAADTANRVRCAVEILNRFGFPSMAVSAITDASQIFDVPKLFEIGHLAGNGAAVTNGEDDQPGN